jgi:hypothetical protein
VPLVLVQRIVFGAIGYARGLGFEPHADFAKAAGHLGEWDGVCDLEFGRDGMPMYIEGPHDDTRRIIHTLRTEAELGWPIECRSWARSEMMARQ